MFRPASSQGESHREHHAWAAAALQFNARGIATIFENRSRTWREIGDRVSRLASALRVHGLFMSQLTAVVEKIQPWSHRLRT
jgi:acyl-CoA synthetase (AMP-forming)/AMP-acid ligase II